MTLPSYQFVSNLTGLQGVTIYPRIEVLGDLQTRGLLLQQPLSELVVYGSRGLEPVS